MRHPRAARSVLALVATLSAATGGTLQAQSQPPAVVVANATLISAYVWRGITFASVPGVQADLGLAAPLAGASLSLGVWTSGEIASASGRDALTMVPGRHGAPTLTTIAPWVDLTRTAGRLAVTAGAMTYIYPEVTGFAADYNTTELYTRLAVASPLAPRLAVYYDVRKVRGAYLEGSLSQEVPLGPIAAAVPDATLSLGAAAGVSAGQGAHSGQSAYFEREGLAFTDLAATAVAPLGPLAITTAGHLTLGRDALARQVDATGRQRSAKGWLTVTATYLIPLGRPRSE